MAGKMVDMEMDDERQLDHPMPIGGIPRSRYPYGLRICLCQDEMDKLKLDVKDCDAGDYVMLRARACVLVAHDEKGSERVELQIEKMAVDDDGDEEET